MEEWKNERIKMEGKDEWKKRRMEVWKNGRMGVWK
jgi:hypothetical protein